MVLSRHTGGDALKIYDFNGMKNISGDRIYQARTAMRLSQEKLAEKAGISRTTLAMIENEKAIPDGNTIAALVKALSVPANVIFFDLDVVCEQQG